MRRGDVHQRGFTLVAVLVVLALVGLGMAAAGPAWSVHTQRDREDELLRVGLLYAQAIAEYRDSSPGSAKAYPDELAWLVNDTRFIGTTRHMRKLYPDPMNPGQPWGLVKDDAGHIVGVYSRSDKAPLRQQRIDLGMLQLEVAERYADWIFKPKDAGVTTSSATSKNTSNATR